MFNDLKEWLSNTILIRLIILIIVFIALFIVLIHRLFVYQIIDGDKYLNDFTLTIKKETTLNSTRGNIYDRSGNLLAYNELAYAVTIEDNYESGKDKNARMNDTIIKTVRSVEGHGDHVINDFYIILNKYGEYEFTIEGTRLERFLADIYGYKSADDLKTYERNATPNDVINYLCSQKKYAIGTKREVNGKSEFIPKEGFSDEEILKIITIRYAMSTNAYRKYVSTVIASDVSDETVAAIMENKNELQGVDIEESTLRKYNDSKYFAHILGYTGYASSEDLEELKDSEHDYTMNDLVGKAGVEKAMEEYLQGTKGSETIYVDNVGKVIDRAERIEPVAGNDVYLSIDSDLQKAVYNMLEQKLAGILVSKIVNMKTYNNSEVKSSRMMIPIDDVYFALFNNGVIDIGDLAKEGAMPYEREVYSAFLDKQERTGNVLKEEMLSLNTSYRDLDKEMQVYESYIVSMLSSSNKGVLLTKQIDENDKTYIAWTTDESIGLGDYLKYALSQGWIDISKFNVKNQYSDTGEIFDQLVDYICEELRYDQGFSKKLYKYMIANDEISGRQICMILFEQRAVYGTAAEKAELESGAKTPYDFIINKIANIEITPAQLALDPCSGSCIISNVNGELLACVTYPGYDSNRLANSIDADYYAKLMTDLSSPMYNCATQQMTAPGSTFKMISSVTALEEGAVNIGETIYCKGTYEYLDTEKTCWVYPGGHGAMDIRNAIGNSCNCFFYEVGYRLATHLLSGGYSEQGGLDYLRKYADLFGLTEKTGVEMEENQSQFSDVLPVDSAIGQGSHNYTTIALSRYVTGIASRGSCYNLSLVSHVVNKDKEPIACSVFFWGGDNAHHT